MNCSHCHKVVLRRFVKGALAALAAAAIVYGIEHVAELQGVVHPVVLAAITGGLLALQKWLKEHGLISEP